MAKRPALRATARKKLPTDKWIVGMIDADGKLQMFPRPTIFLTYDAAVKDAEASYLNYPRRHFVVFAKVCVIGPSRPPVPPALKQEYTT